jgi:hypothetical protein
VSVLSRLSSFFIFFCFLKSSKNVVWYYFRKYDIKKIKENHIKISDIKEMVYKDDYYSLCGIPVFCQINLMKWPI